MGAMIERKKKIMMMLQAGKKKIGGIDVFMDSARYDRGNAKADSAISDSDYFLAGIFDTGNPSSKSYTITYTTNTVSNAANIRFFNDLTANSIDYWGVGYSRPTGTRVFSSSGRYIITTIYKPDAPNMYLYDNTNQRYIFKGSNVE